MGILGKVLKMQDFPRYYGSLAKNPIKKSARKKKVSIHSFLSSTDVADSIKLDHVGVPSYAIQDKEAVLECPFNLEGASLYCVKWYKNGQEFFR